MPGIPSFLARMQDLIDSLRLRLQRLTSIGYRGERAAAKMLKQKNFRVMARNLRNRFGEIDIIALTPGGRTVVIVEVKTADGPNARPELRVDQKKQKRLTALAAQAVRRYKLQDKPIRFDVVAVNLGADNEPTIRHYEGAFDSHV